MSGLFGASGGTSSSEGLSQEMLALRERSFLRLVVGNLGDLTEATSVILRLAAKEAEAIALAVLSSTVAAPESHLFSPVVFSIINVTKDTLIGN